MRSGQVFTTTFDALNRDDYGFASPTHSRQFRACFDCSLSGVEPPAPPTDGSMSNGPIRHHLLVDWPKTLESKFEDGPPSPSRPDHALAGYARDKCASD